LILGDTKTKDAVSITNLQVNFDIAKKADNTDSPNSATIEVYNLSDELIKKLDTEFLACSFSCGYEDTGLTNLIIGQVVEFSTRRSGTDKITQILIGEGYVELNHQILSSVVPAGKTVKDVVEEIRKQMPNVARGAYTGLNLNNEVMYGYPLTGSPKQMLRELSDAYRLEWRVDRNTLYVTDKSGLADKNYKGTAFVLNEDSGLVDIPYKTSAEGRKSKGDKTKRKGVQFKALLNGKIIPGSVIRLESELLTGWYKVVSARYYGDYRGNDWYIEGFCQEILKEDVPE